MFQKKPIYIIGLVLCTLVLLTGLVLTTVRSAFWPVLIVRFLGDSLCIFMLIRIRRKKKAFAPAEQSPILVEDA